MLNTEVFVIFRTEVAVETIKIVMRKEGFHETVTQKKPFVCKTNKLKRMNFAEEYLKQYHNYWTDVLVSDESKFNVFRNEFWCGGK